MKKIIILILIIVLFSNIVNATFVDDATQKIICKAARQFCELYQAILNPQAKLTNQLISSLPESAQKTIMASQDPKSLAKSEVLNSIGKKNPEVISMINNVKQVESYLKDIGKDPNKEGNKLNTEYTDDGSLILKDKNNNIIGKIPKGFETMTGEKGELIFVNKKADPKSTLQLGEFSLTGVTTGAEIKLTEDKDTKNIFVKGSADLKIGNFNYNNIGNADFKINKKTQQVEYASFLASSGKFDFKYGDNMYTFFAGGKDAFPSTIVFDPKNKKISGANFKMDMDNQKLNCGLCQIELDDNRNLNKLFIKSGSFSDNENNIDVNGKDFLVCLSSISVSEFDKARGCSIRDGAGKERDIKNVFWLTKDVNANAIKTRGKLDYTVGFTKISAEEDSETKLIQSSDLKNQLQFTGNIKVNKEGVEIRGKYAQCGGLPKFLNAFIVKYDEKNTCGTSIVLDRKGIPGKVTEDLYILPAEGGNMYNIDPVGKIFVKDKNGKSKFGEPNPISSAVKERLNILYGQKFANPEGSSVTIADGMDKYVKNIKPDSSVLDNLAVLGVKGKKEEAISKLNLLDKRISDFSNLVYEGYSVDDALKDSELEKEKISLFFKEGINSDGSINYGKIPNIVNQLKTSCSGNTYSEISCLKTTDFVSGLYKEKIKQIEYKDIPNEIKSKLTGNPELDADILHKASVGYTKLPKEFEKYNKALKIVESAEKKPEYATFMVADSALQGNIIINGLTAFGMENLDYLVVLGPATKGVKYAFKGGVNFAKNSGRMANYIEGIKDARYFATLKAITEGKDIKSLIKAEDIPAIAKQCLA